MFERIIPPTRHANWHKPKRVSCAKPIIRPCSQLVGNCRAKSRRGELKEGVYEPPEMLRFPEPIPALRPNHVTLGRDGSGKIEMYIGWYPLGVRAYPEGYPEYPPPFQYGDRELLKGLWYYEDGYGTDPDAYDRQIDELLSKNKKLKGTVPESKARSS